MVFVSQAFCKFVQREKNAIVIFSSWKSHNHIKNFSCVCLLSQSSSLVTFVNNLGAHPDDAPCRWPHILFTLSLSYLEINASVVLAFVLDSPFFFCSQGFWRPRYLLKSTRMLSQRYCIWFHSRFFPSSLWRILRLVITVSVHRAKEVGWSLFYLFAVSGKCHILIVKGEGSSPEAPPPAKVSFLGFFWGGWRIINTDTYVQASFPPLFLFCLTLPQESNLTLRLNSICFVRGCSKQGFDLNNL